MFPRRGAIALITTALAVVLLFNFKTPDEASVDALGPTGGPAVAATPATPAAPSTTGTPTTQTVTGSLITTRYGDVEVQVTVAGGKITAVDAVELPSGGRSGRISDSVAPILASEALTAQSANIDIVSGATYTSEAYASSLQAALDQAGIATAQVSG
jgi:uncharacterized protein with FMN-binding domain